MDQMKSYIYGTIADIFDVPVEEISDNMGPADIYNWDSLGQINLILRLEKELNIQIPLEDAMSINSIKDIVDVTTSISPKGLIK